MTAHTERVPSEDAKRRVEQLGFEGMPRRLYPCTPTRLPTWLDCPRRYRMSYLDRPAAAQGAALGAQQPRRQRPQRAGRLVAAAAGRSGPCAAAGGLVDRGWINEGFADEAQSARSARARGRHGRGVRRRAGPGRRAGRGGADRGHPHRPIAFSGRIDRLDDRRPRRRHRAGRGRLQDRAAPAHRGRRAQLAGRWPCTRSPRRGCCAGPATGSSCTTCPPGRCSPGRTPAIAGQAPGPGRGHRARSAPRPTSGCGTACPRSGYDEVFPPRPGASCGWCDYLRHCPEGAAAAVTRRPWDGLAP